MVSSSANALEFKGVSAGYGETVVLEDISLAIAPGESISILGRNGVGKTTLLATAMGHTTLHKGELELSGKTLNRVPIYRRAAAGLGFVPQEREIFPSLSVLENLEVGARRRASVSCRRSARFSPRSPCARTSTSAHARASGPTRASSSCFRT